MAHWQSIAIAACEQCGGNRVPVIHEVSAFASWAKAQPGARTGQALLLSLRPGTRSVRDTLRTPGEGAEASTPITFLSGPEGGLSSAEEEVALSAGFVPVTLGPRVLRAETAALVALAALLST